MSGAGAQHPTWEPMRKAIEAHAKLASGGDSYVLGDFVLIGYVIDLDKTEEASEGGEYIMATSSQAPHIVEGLVSQMGLFHGGGSDDDD